MTPTSVPPAIAALVRPGEDVWVPPTGDDRLLGLSTWSSGDSTCLALLARGQRYESGCGTSAGASYTSREVDGIGTVWFGFAVEQAPTIDEVFGRGTVEWIGPLRPDGQRPHLAIATGAEEQRPG